MEELLKFLMALNESMKPTHFDAIPKEIGDRVVVANKAFLSYFIDVETKEQLASKMEFVSEEVKNLFTLKDMIVVEKNLNIIFNCGHCSNEHSHDLMLYVPALDKKFYTSSRDVIHSTT